MLHVGKRVVEQANLILALYFWQSPIEVTFGNLFGRFSKVHQWPGNAFNGLAGGEVDRYQADDDQHNHAKT